MLLLAREDTGERKEQVRGLELIFSTFEVDEVVRTEEASDQIREDGLRIRLLPVSADFCDAAANLCGLGTGDLVELQVQWSPAVRENVPAISTVRLSRNCKAVQGTKTC